MGEIRKAYHDIFRSCHPDKNSAENWERTNQKSKVLGGIKDILLKKHKGLEKMYFIHHSTFKGQKYSEP